MPFEFTSANRPAGDQPQAIERLAESIVRGSRFQTLRGVTGSGKTYTMANVIDRVNRPTLVISHNKTLAAQLYSEFKNFFPKNAVEYFVSYFDFYQPEAYLPQTDTYIEKDSAINEEIERLRMSATSALMTRDDVIVVASVSCIYGHGSPGDYKELLFEFKIGDEVGRDPILTKLVDMQYNRNDIEPGRSRFRVRGDVIEVGPANSSDGLRIELFGDRIDKITEFDLLTGDRIASRDRGIIFPAKQFVTPYEKMKKAIEGIKAELEDRLQWFEKENKLLEAQRLKMRTTYDIEMMQEVGYCSGIENYSRHISGRAAGTPPYTLLDFFPKDFLTIIDESHATVPQLRGMFAGDRSRKTVLVEHGFRLPSALDNRPLDFDEFLGRQRQIVFVSATPAPYELDKSAVVADQVIRPTGLVDPTVTIKPLKGQIDDIIDECRRRVEKKERVLITTLTKKTAEDLADYLAEVGLKVRYLHSDIGAIERVEILRALRKAEFDVLVGINLLREGLDLPEVSLVAILDADKEGFLRSETSLIQTAGRAARHINGEVILYADTRTDSIRKLVEITGERRVRQLAYNAEHGITPQSVTRAIEQSLATYEEAREMESSILAETGGDLVATELVLELEGEMEEAANNLQFERAALLRDQIAELQKRMGLDAGPQGVRYEPKTEKKKKRARVKGADVMKHWQKQKYGRRKSLS
jgi:excinuclease ABC subunit B